MISKATETLIEGIANLFEDDLKQALEYMRGNRKMTIQKQLANRYRNMFPRFPLEESLDIASDIIERNIRTIYQIRHARDMMKQLSDPNNYSKVLDINLSLDSTNKRLYGEYGQQVKEQSNRTKQRGGASTRSFDNIEEERRWDEEDSKATLSDVALNFKTITTENIKTAKIIPSFQEQIKSDNYNLQQQPPTTPEPEEGRYLNTLDVSAMRSKVLSKKLKNIVNLTDKLIENKEKTKHVTSVTAFNILNAINIDVSDTRDKFFNQFYELFDYYPKCQ